MPKRFRITYTCDEVHNLDDDFLLLEIEAHNQGDADLIVSNIERFFNGVTIFCEEEEPPKKKRRECNSDRRKTS
jgi:hypothetical protein